MIMLISSHKHYHVESLRKVDSALTEWYGLLKSIVSKKVRNKKEGFFRFFSKGSCKRDCDCCFEDVEYKKGVLWLGSALPFFKPVSLKVIPITGMSLTKQHTFT